MILANIDITRVIAHEVVRAVHLEEAPPIYSEQLVSLDARGKELVGKRLVSTVASGSHCVDVTIDDSSLGSPFHRATAMIDGSDEEFVENSRCLAIALSSSQTSGSIKSGSAIFIQGTCIADDKECRFIAIIKADSDQALYKTTKEDRVTLTFVNDMLLGEAQRLIKIALFIEEVIPENSEDQNLKAARSPGDFSVKVFDHMMQNSGNGNAAVYFYSTFLKSRLAENAPRQTMQFYNTAREYINRLSLPQEERVDLRGDLISYLRSNRQTIEPRTFAKEVLPAEYQDGFIKECKSIKITGAISKDLSLLKGRLRRRSMRFSSNVTLSASPEVFKNAVKILGAPEDGWTKLKILGTVDFDA